MALQLVCWMLDREIQVSVLAGVTLLCSWVRQKANSFILNGTCILNNPVLHACTEVTKLITKNNHEHP